MSLSVSDTAGHDRAKYGDEIRSIADHSDRAIAIVLRPQFPYPLPSIPAVDFRKRAASEIIRRESGSRSNVQRKCRLPGRHESHPVSDIFICYSHSDKTIATRLRDRLQREGWSVWMDLHIDAGHRWADEIQAQLAAARAVVTLWSVRSVASRFVMDEAHEAADREIIFPVRLEDLRIPYGFRQFQTPDLIGWDGGEDCDGARQLVSSLRKHLTGATPPATPVQPAQPETHARPRTPTTQASPSAAAARSPAAKPLAPGDTFRDRLRNGGEGPLMVVVPAGRFVMGSPANEPQRAGDEGPLHEVRIAQPFALGVYAVTFDDYDLYVAASGGRQPADNGWGRARRPVLDVSWHDALAYCRWLQEETGRAYRLPSEAEWEYACRAGTTTPFHCGHRLTTALANFDGNHTYNGSAKGEYRGQTLPVGSFPANAFGLYDMHGNVWEWCADAWHDSYQGAPTDGSPWDNGKASGNVPRVLRGGSWLDDPGYCRAAWRCHLASDVRKDYLGFRVCCGSPIELLGAAPLSTVTLPR
ncbi:MAG: SUMF1/EgtB/PvdO family nonheme iron enzyme [Candidatus Accumulibacter sp.]|uniref:SUMF1/EgtB/PvdO family nonheme iron enzyme n=3 Tax=Accumulibacter sp. TaxID=2053492 RepID=UPI001AC0F047|nr:SUMF1/EgtB/PvdO family nonheme iron enzyme [Accumulibacter sp.]MBN8519487.1 SUMF1/EgtB/PvdO family nonheme iron enzyme [Accumulibacter sp.]